MEEKAITSPLKAIRAKCIDCCCNQMQEVKTCGCDSCPLFPFRMGKNPYRKKRVMTDEQKDKLKKTLQIARENRKYDTMNDKGANKC